MYAYASVYGHELSLSKFKFNSKHTGADVVRSTGAH